MWKDSLWAAENIYEVTGCNIQFSRVKAGACMLLHGFLCFTLIISQLLSLVHGIELAFFRTTVVTSTNILNLHNRFT